MSTIFKIKPRLTYVGLTVVMSNPSRLDIRQQELLSANGGWFLRNECLAPDMNILQCEVRLKDDRSPLLPNTKCVLLLGKPATELWLNNTTNTLGEIRGSVYPVDGIPHIPSYLPQEACDLKDHEAELNPLLAAKDYSEDINLPAADAVKAEKRRHGVTAHSNWRFWLKADVKKAIRLVQNNGHIPPPNFLPHYILYPNSNEVIQTLLTTKNKFFYLDIETDENLAIKCIGYNFSDSSDIVTIPLITHSYTKAYDNIPMLLHAVCIACRDNVLVSHNGSCFDWLVMMWKYGMVLGHNFYDTMLAQHRIFPDLEKSLGHCISYWLYEQFHKDEGTGAYGSRDDAERLWRYCGKDVYTMRLIHEAQAVYAKRVPGLEASIAQVNKSIRAYLTMTLMGVHYRATELDAIVHENDRLCMQYLRMLSILIGSDNLRALQRKSKKPIPNSNVQCTTYFHGMLGYKIVYRSPKTGKPSLGKKSMYRLRLLYDNPAIDIIVAYRETIKESGSLGFIPWATKEKEQPCQKPI